MAGKQQHDRDGLVARRILEREQLPQIQATVTGEGRGIEVDRQGALLATESC
ncbi:agmatine deiminase family protein [Amycolatopsis jiangsuensis]|uniref:Agmatine/peptidylarginine deiminase n=1 Tax=Amycolatopsis jiangsuensis TaxID=1181879 RepID=A0A840IPY8_9PSEU|nr:agmatine deiminase family protein [Amycolatopsis jiangsuensis]MBB4683619.1 agmatine/peptidylarginine deiminase [Amycolatopsis jiangsuensis]